MIRKSLFNGTFYPGTAAEIERMLRVLRERAGEQPRVPHPPIVIVPHAAWQYSGLAAVRGIATLVASPPERIVLIGPSHRHYYLGFSLAGYEKYETPLGEIDVDLGLQQELKDWTGSGFVPEAHAAEHSLEVIVPIIQYLLPGATKILPILAGSVSRIDVNKMADALAALLDPMRDALVVSTDLSHFYTYEEARALDQKTLHLVIEGEEEELIVRSGEGGRLCCGFTGVVVAIALSRRWKLGAPELLAYFNSGDTGGDRDSVVGYAALAYPPPKLAAENNTGTED